MTSHEKLFEILKHITQKELTIVLGTNSSTIANWKNRKSIGKRSHIQDIDFIYENLEQLIAKTRKPREAEILSRLGIESLD